MECCVKEVKSEYASRDALNCALGPRLCQECMALDPNFVDVLFIIWKTLGDWHVDVIHDLSQTYCVVRYVTVYRNHLQSQDIKLRLHHKATRVRVVLADHDRSQLDEGYVVPAR